MSFIISHFVPGGEYPAVVEFAPFQKVPKKKSKRPDTKIGLIEQGLYFTIPPKETPATLLRH